MVCIGKGFRTVSQLAGKAVLHGEEARLDPAVVVDEIFNSEFNPLLVPKDNPEFIRQLPATNGGEHLGVAAKLDRVIRFWREGQLCVPHLIPPGCIER